MAIPKSKVADYFSYPDKADLLRLFLFILQNILYLCKALGNNMYNMMALNLLEQQRADEVLRLEIAYSNLYSAYISGNKRDMISRYIDANGVGIPYFTNAVHSKTKQAMLSKGILPDVLPIDIREIKDETLLRMNIQGCLNALQEEISLRNIYKTRYTYAQNILYQSNRTFWQDEVLHQSSQGQQLKVADLLAVSKYAVSVAEAIDPDNEGFAKANAAITVFQGIDTILNNKPEDNPVNKMLHLATSFLSSVVKSSLKDSDAKRGVTITAIMVDLAIDFFCRK